MKKDIFISEVKILRAKVIENNQSCAMDLQCYLLLEDGIKIIYGQGFQIVTPNQKNNYCFYQPAQTINKDDYIEAFVKKEDKYTYNVCGNKYYVKKLPN